jgi:threonine dehydrogenase-like Zn-dependent dehydrogenase
LKARTIRYTRPRLVEIVEVDVPEPGPGEVLVEGLACGVCAWDLHVYEEGCAWEAPPGHEGIGRVVCAGVGVEAVQAGEVVVGSGLGFAELALRSERGLYVLPEAAAKSPEHWLVEPVSCAVTGLDHCQVGAGDRIAVVGCGFMGLLLVQLLGRCPLDALIAIDLDERRLKLARQFGATDAITPGEVDPDELRRVGFDCVVDSSGVQAGLDLASRIVKDGGRLNLFGWNHGTGSFPGDIWHMRGLTIVNSAPNSAVRDTWPIAIRMLARGYVELQPLVSHVVELDRYPALLAEATATRASYLKGVVKLAA